MSSPIFQVVQADGRIMVYGGTYDHREAIRAHGGKWNAAEKAWYLPAGTETSFLPAPPKPVAAAPRIRTLPAAKPREEWTADEWSAYVAAQYRARRYVVGRCCKHAESFWDYAMGPTHYRCERHGVTKCNYTGD
jgi:hypothetical protein